MNPKLKTAIIGCGVVAAKHMKAILHNSDRIELAAISDINDSAMNTLLKKSY
ncbi:gfo/Idh/MocA family oxidoreductase, partial [Candidatus Nomurabacteria bacterium]|nr:gfo/Idh/MocA family oxidoreductase [Candidatus Nomurabacteria bacterium]